MQTGLNIIPVVGLPLVQEGDDIALMICDAVQKMGNPIKEGDILVVAQKIVSKSEGCTVLLKDVDPSQKAISLASETDKDPRLVELILRESS